MGLERTIAPATTPISVAEAKDFCRIDTTDFDELIEVFIAAAVSHIEGAYQRPLEQQEWELTLDAFPICKGGLIEIPLWPTISVDEVAYTDSAGDPQILVEDDDYQVDLKSHPARLMPVNGGAWPVAKLYTLNAVTVTFTAGYIPTATSDPVSNVPEAIKLALKIMVADMFENRESVTPANANKVEIPTTAERLLSIYDPRVFA